MAQHVSIAPSELSVMMVTPYLPPHLGGIETYVFNLAVQSVRQHCIKVVVAATATSVAVVSDTERVCAGVYGLHLRWLPAVSKVSNTPVGIGWTRPLRQIAREENIDLVNAHAPVPLVADIAARGCPELPSLLTYHSGPIRKGNWWIDVGLRGYERWVLAGTAAVEHIAADHEMRVGMARYSYEFSDLLPVPAGG
jgi:glycosyltransferase involved in cell wall biosynthesis